MTRNDTLTRCTDKEKSTTRPPLYNIHNNIPLPGLTPIIPCPDSDRDDTGGVHVNPPRRSTPDIIRFCPTLGCMHLVQSIIHRAAASVALDAPTVPDMWSRAEDNLLVQTISTKIRLNTLRFHVGCFLESGCRGHSGPPVTAVSSALQVL